MCFVNVICRYKKKSRELRQHYIESVSSEAVDGEVKARQANPDPTDAAAGAPTPAVSFRSEWLNLVETACRKCSTESDLDDAMKVTFVYLGCNFQRSSPPDSGIQGQNDYS